MLGRSVLVEKLLYITSIIQAIDGNIRVGVIKEEDASWNWKID